VTAENAEGQPTAEEAEQQPNGPLEADDEPAPTAAQPLPPNLVIEEFDP
jgi:hypothetical protein